MEYLYTQKNAALHELEKEWLAGKSRGCYLLTGKSGCGKTTFLKQFEFDCKRQSDRNTFYWLSAEQWMTDILQDKDILTDVTSDILVIENAEQLVGRKCTEERFFRQIKNWQKIGNRLCIVTSSEPTAPDGVEIIECEQIEITFTIVKQMADQLQVALSNEKVKRIWEETEGSMSCLRGLLYKEKLVQIID
ncbi:MAG: ATP-binding protein [Lachnospiraceae bacterium]|nr:ATP-binding protein [Lachnospiraceae bacterium]